MLRDVSKQKPREENRKVEKELQMTQMMELNS